HTDSPTGLRGLARVALAEGDAAAALDLAGRALERYAEPPPDLVREVRLYAARLHDEERKAEARRRIDEALAARDAALRTRLAEELAKVRQQPPHDGGQRSANRSPRTRPTPTTGPHSADTEESDDAAEQVAALPPAPA